VVPNSQLSAELAVSLRTSGDHPESSPLTGRQAAVLRAVVGSYVGEGGPIGSETISHLLPIPLSSASIRNTLAELASLGLVDKPHRSSGRVPTESGLRVFVDELLAPADLPSSELRDIAYRLEGAVGDGVVSVASALLSRHTHQLGFVIGPRLDRLLLRHVSLVRLSAERLLVVLVAETGTAHRRVVLDDPVLDQRALDRIAALLNERVAGRCLAEVRTRLEREARALRREADRLLAKALEIGRRALCSAEGQAGDLVIETRLALLDQPEFSDPRRVRDLFEAIETKERLLEVVDQVLEPEGVSVAIGEELDDPGLRRCALVASPYGSDGGEAPLGVLGVIGPSRMDFARVIPLVEYLSELVTGKLRE
jgi:heat-inducible transcriptional repressor